MQEQNHRLHGHGGPRSLNRTYPTCGWEEESEHLPGTSPVNLQQILRPHLLHRMRSPIRHQRSTRCPRCLHHLFLVDLTDRLGRLRQDQLRLHLLQQYNTWSLLYRVTAAGSRISSTSCTNDVSSARMGTATSVSDAIAAGKVVQSGTAFAALPKQHSSESWHLQITNHCTYVTLDISSCPSNTTDPLRRPR